jgi:hypothetical protein
MSGAAKSVFAFGLYMLGEGAILMLAPGLLLGAVGVAYSWRAASTARSFA